MELSVDKTQQKSKLLIRKKDADMNVGILLLSTAKTTR